MKISWQIEKKRGNFRPGLRYTITLEEYERELAVNTVNIKTSIPKINNPYQNFCLPANNERKPDWQPEEFHLISSPYFRDGSVSDYIRLPFRLTGEYPEVAESFAKLRAGYEIIVREAYGSAPIKQEDELDTSIETKQCIAAHIASKKMLAFCSN